jgi:DNA-binding MarR family transcriptional regulator
LGEIALTHVNKFGEASGPRQSATIWQSGTLRARELAALATMAGCLVVEAGYAHTPDFVLVDLCSETDRPQDSLSEIVRYLCTHRSTALVWTDLEGLEAAYAALPHGQCHFLIDADDVEAVPILAGGFGRGAMERLHDRNREVEFGSLHRISDELAEFARTLARMAETDGKPGLSDKPVSFRPAPIGGFEPFATRAPAPVATSAKAIREMIKRRRLRDSFFDAELFADPAWDILLDLMAARLEQRNVSVSSLCIAAAVPPTTALRWITAMTENGMLLRQQDPDDARRVFIVLSDEVAAKLDDYFAASERPNR